LVKKQAPTRCLFFYDLAMESVAASTGCADASVTPSDFHFDLPPELIAQVPAERRDQARLLVLDRPSGTLTHGHVCDLPSHLRTGDLLVVNDTKVIPARLFGRTPSGGAVEVLLIRQSVEREASTESWHCLGKPAKRLRAGAQLTFPEGVRATIASVDGNGQYTLAFDDGSTVQPLIQRHGEIPLPPYIRRPDGPLPLDQARYQTVFASVPGAIAAPTAGLHFTEELLAAVQRRGAEIVRLTLHVGPGTFLPIRAGLDEHVMTAEWCAIPTATAARIRAVKAAGGRVIAVGTTTTRALESASGPRWAACFITPGFRFRVIDALFTNFHLPGSTLLLLVSAFAGTERIRATYAEAVRHSYRFYSYGDAMLIQ
jgi:S-adenosylmethionine:tRNA ribosyltransferase-isomerase